MEQTEITVTVDPQLLAFVIGFALAGLLFLLVIRRVIRSLKKQFTKLIEDQNKS